MPINRTANRRRVLVLACFLLQFDNDSVRSYQLPMVRLGPQARRNASMAGRILSCILALGLILIMGPGQLPAFNTPVAPKNYARLLDYIQKDDLQDPLIVFGEVEEKFDRRLNQENIAYINENNDLLGKIQSHLKGEHLKWQLSSSSSQIWVVPEHRNEYAQLFESYCRDAVDYLLGRVKLPNPYNAISTLKSPLPIIGGGDQQGITAYLVHNIADEYIEEYLFFDQENDDTQLKIKLSNREFDGKIGSYTSKLKIGPDHQYEFIRERFTLWQNSARNPLNVLIVPVEETLHILLRSSTERAMHEELTFLKPQTLQEVQKVIDNWMAVEEAVVGGLVWEIMPGLLDRFLQGESEYLLVQTLAERDAHDQYRFLDQGISLVNRLGVEGTVSLYQSSAKKFNEKLKGLSVLNSSAEILHPPLVVN